MTLQEINSTSMFKIGTIFRGTYRIESSIEHNNYFNGESLDIE